MGPFRKDGWSMFAGRSESSILFRSSCVGLLSRYRDQALDSTLLYTSRPGLYRMKITSIGRTGRVCQKEDEYPLVSQAFQQVLGFCEFGVVYLFVSRLGRC